MVPLQVHRGSAAPCLAALVLLCACGAEAPATAPSPAAATAVVATAKAAHALPVGPVGRAPWAAVGCTPGAAQAALVACVDGAAVTADRVAMAWQAHPEWSRDQVLAAVVQAEVVAQAAAAAGGWRQAQTQQAHRQAMARTLLERAMAKVTPKTLHDADIAAAYKNPAIRVHYDHADAYFAIDAQVLCCSGSPQQCGAREEVRQCIDKAEPVVRDLHAALVADPPATGNEMWARVKVLAGRFPDAAAAEVQFFYDKAKPHADQKGYDVMVQEYADAVTALQPGQLSAPIRTAFGWHIAFLDKVDPARRASWRDPAVRADIAAHIVDPVREREAQRLVFEQLRQRGAALFFERIDEVVGIKPATKPAGADDDL